MLYIDYIENNTFRFSNKANGQGEYQKFLSKPMEAWADLLERVWIRDVNSGINYLNCYDPTQITFNGSVYDADSFVEEFNAIGSLTPPAPLVPEGAVVSLDGDPITTADGNYIVVIV